MGRKLISSGTLVVGLLALGGGLALWATQPRPRAVDTPTLLVRVREVARLQTLDVTLYKKISFDPLPEASDSFFQDALSWAKFALRPPHGRAIIFADVHIGLDLAKLRPEDIRRDKDRVELTLPPLVTSVELRPADTEVIGSTLDSKQTAQLFELAKGAFEREVLRDERLLDKARASAEQALSLLFLQLGFHEVVFHRGLDRSS